MSGGRMKWEVPPASVLVRKRGMKLFQILLGGLLVVACGEEKKEGGQVEKTPVTASGQESPVTGAPEEAGQSGAGESATGDVADLPPLPEVMTKEFIMGLWAKPHEEREVIKEFDCFGAPGVWKIVRMFGPSKGELEEGPEGMSVSKIVARRFVVARHVTKQPDSDEDWVEYSVESYDYKMKKYRSWSLLPDGFIAEAVGRRYWRNLMEWESVRYPEEGVQVKFRATYQSEDGKRGKATMELKRDGEAVVHGKIESTWLSGVPEEHRSPVKP